MPTEDGRPITTKTILMCQGTCKGPTPHEYAFAETATPEDKKPVDKQDRTWWRLVFQCIYCKDLRVWGATSNFPSGEIKSGQDTPVVHGRADQPVTMSV